MSKLQRLFMVLCSALIFIAASTAVASAAPTAVKITAYQGVTLNYNGQQVPSTNQPYIINNVTYVPFRVLAESFGKQVSWDSANYRVVISDGTETSAKEMELYNQIADLKNQNTELQKTITSLKAQVTALQTSADSTDDTSTSEIAEALEESLDDAGDQYFDDEDITLTFAVTGDEDDLVYNVKMDLSDSSEYEDLTECSTSTIQSFMSKIKSLIASEIYNTDFEDADITGKLIDKNDTSNYVTYNGSSYSYSWSSGTDDIDEIEETVADYFDDLDVGKYYLGDENVAVTITVSGDEDAIAYRANIDCSDSDYDDMTEITSTRLTNFMKALKSKITSTISDTDFEDAEITGVTYDASDASNYITFDGSTYDFSW